MRQREWEWFQFKDGVIDRAVYCAYHEVIALHLGGSRTILVRSGMSGSLDLNGVPERKRPDAVIDGVEEMLPWL